MKSQSPKAIEDDINWWRTLPKSYRKSSNSKNNGPAKINNIFYAVLDLDLPPIITDFIRLLSETLHFKIHVLLSTVFHTISKWGKDHTINVDPISLVANFYVQILSERLRTLTYSSYNTINYNTIQVLHRVHYIGQRMFQIGSHIWASVWLARVACLIFVCMVCTPVSKFCEEVSRVSIPAMPSVCLLGWFY